MTREGLQAAALVLATMTMGLITGAFALYAHTVMPGLSDTDDRTFVTAFQELDRSIINPWFMAGGFIGALVFTALAAGLHIGGAARTVLPWIVAALVLYLIAVVITIGVEVPVNDDLKAAGDPDQIANLATVRNDFDETTWARWNVVRTLTSLAAFGCLAWSLVRHGRVAASTEGR
ncbi:MAG TPA: DUF1772 domain-containing protein [Nocardioidaceae bacterium]|nr:DUF1772 domain-containing protein [Nocardioidaceae bacterium]